VNTGITVGWKSSEKAPIIMQTSGYDDSDYSFQVHAVGVHYSDEYDQPKTVWTSGIGEKSVHVKNTSKIIGPPSRPASWTEDIKKGDYSTAPGLSQINDYMVCIMGNEWMEKACVVNIPDFNVSHYRKP